MADNEAPIIEAVPNLEAEVSGDEDEGSDDQSEVASPEVKAAIEREQEEQFRAKYGNMGPPTRGGAGGRGGHSAFLQKRLAKGQKYFDSGDYQMAKQKSRLGGGLAPGRAPIIVPILDGHPTGDAIPTPDSVPARKTSIIQPINDASRSMHMPSDPAHLAGGASPVSPGPGQPLPNPAITKLVL